MVIGLVGRTLGQPGIGNIGAEVFRMARRLDKAFIARDPYADPASAAGLGVELVSIEDLFRLSDFLSASCPLDDRTRGIVSACLLGEMKPPAFLINTARGPVLDRASLTEALRRSANAGAGLDAFEEGPTGADETLAALDNVILTPHSLCWADQCFAGNGTIDVRTALAGKRDEKSAGSVNSEITGLGLWRLADFQTRLGG